MSSIAFIPRSLRPGVGLLALLLSPAWARAQIIANGGFDNSANCVTANPTDPFRNGCVLGWTLSHGSPQVFGNPANPYAYMWSASDGNGEGLYTPVALTANQRYQVSFAARSVTTAGGTSQLNVALTSSLAAGAGTTTIPTPNPISSLPDLTVGTAWARYTLQFNAPSWATQLWVHPPASANRNDIHLDSVRITACMTQDVYYQNEPSLIGATRTQGRIFAGTAVTNTVAQGPVVVQFGQTTSFRALREISLQNGFSAVAGAEFEAVMVPCRGRNARPAESAGGKEVASNGVTDPVSGQEAAACCPIQDPCDCLGVPVNARRIAYTPPPVTETPLRSQQVRTASDSVAVVAGLILAPNPTAGRLEFRPAKSLPDHPGLFYIYRKDGQEMKVLDCKSLPRNENAFVMDVAFLANGIYHYRYVSGQQVESGHFMVKK